MMYLLQEEIDRLISLKNERNACDSIERNVHSELLKKKESTKKLNTLWEDLRCWKLYYVKRTVDNLKCVSFSEVNKLALNKEKKRAESNQASH